MDEHYYTYDGYLFDHNDRYDSFDRSGAHVFVGEYAATSAGIGTIETKSNIWEAVEEASYLTGLERNGDVVDMASYAPTFAKVNAQSWNVNLIWFDSRQTVLTPSYYVQMLLPTMWVRSMCTPLLTAAVPYRTGCTSPLPATRRTRCCILSW